MVQRTRKETLQGRYFAQNIGPGVAMGYTGNDQVIERISAHGAAGATVTLTIPGAGGAVVFTLGAGQAVHVFDVLGRYDTGQFFVIDCSAAPDANAIVELIDLT